MKKQKFSIPKNHNGVIMVPLGGCGQIGKNMTLYCYKGTWIMIDIGASFGDERIVPGADIIIPDITFIKKNNIKISAIVLTHVHEDHVGAASHYIRDLNCPIYGTSFAIDFTKLRFQDRNVDPKKIKFIEITDEIFKIGDFTINPIGLTHSIPEMQAMFISAGDVTIFHTGDWKLDPNPVVGKTSDLKKIESVTKKGVTAMVCDSTNVMSEGRSRSESDLEDSFFEIMKDKKGRIFITSFASNVARLQTISQVAKKLNRSVGMSGLSLHKITSIAKKNGYLDGFEFLDAKDAMNCKPSESIIICTGCQGEPMASIAKASNDSHPILKINNNDTVIFSSKIIPGNEKKILYTMNRFADKNIDVITERDHFVHVSGHPKKDEIREIYNLSKPKFAIPVHGDSVNLRHHCEMVKKEKLAKDAVFLRDGDVLLIEADKVEKIGTINADFVCVDGSELISPASIVMKERRKLKNDGVVFISIVLDIKANLMKNLEIRNIGLIDDNAKNNEMIKDLSEKLIKQANKDYSKISKDKLQSKLAELINHQVFKFVKHFFQKEPIIDIIFHEA